MVTGSFKIIQILPLLTLTQTADVYSGLNKAVTCPVLASSLQAAGILTGGSGVIDAKWPEPLKRQCKTSPLNALFIVFSLGSLASVLREGVRRGGVEIWGTDVQAVGSVRMKKLDLNVRWL